MRAVSQVPAALENPFQAWSRILYMWVQPAGQVYYVSPLVHNLGEQNLPVQTIRNVHLAAAESLLASQRVDLLDAAWCFHSLCKGENYTRAGSVLISLFQTAKTANQAQLLRYCGLLRYAAANDLPAAMPSSLRALIRTEQVRLHQLLGLDATAYQQWLVQYADADDGPMSERVMLRMLKVLNASEWSLPEFAHDLTFVVHNQAALVEATAVNLPISQLAELFWLPVRSIQSSDDLTQWCVLAEELREHAAVHVWHAPIAQTAVTLVAQQVAGQSGEPDNAQTALRVWANYFEKQDLQLLRAIVESVSLLLRFHQDAARPSVLTEGAAIAASLTNSEARYILYFALGKACYEADLLAKGAEWLEQAVAVQCTQQDSFVEALVYAAASTAPRDLAVALRFSQQAEALAKANEEVPELEYLQVLAELALAQWLNQQAQVSFGLFEQVVSRLLDGQITDLPTNWVRFYILLRHALGYIAPATARERPPQQVADGSEYVPPHQGFFLSNTKDLSDLYAAHPDHYILFYYMALFADGVGETARAYVWSQQAFDAARQAGGTQAQLMVATLCGQYALATGHYAEALEAQMLAAAMSAYVEQTGLPKEQVLNTFSVEELAGQRPGPVWDAAEDTTVMLAVLPMLVQVLTAQATNEASVTDLTQKMLLTIEQYHSVASNQTYWTQVNVISAEVLTGSSTSSQLLDRATILGRHAQHNLQIMCLLGTIARTKDGLIQATQLLNILPYLTNVQRVQPIIIRTVLVPFAKFWSKAALQACFVGARLELEQQLAAIEAVDQNEPNAVQQVLLPAVAAAEITLESSRQAWLHQILPV